MFLPQKLKGANLKVMYILEKGAFSIQRTRKHYSRSEVDLSLELIVNKDAGCKLKGIVSFQSLDEALQQWALTMIQRAQLFSELKAFVGLEQEDNAASRAVHPG